MLVTVLLWIHVAVSLVAIAAGLIVLRQWLGGRQDAVIAFWFLVTTVATSVTGFLLPATQILPSHVFGILSLALLAAAWLALYRRRLAGRWRAAYVLTAGIALYLNVFVLVVQAFLKVPALQALAPTQGEPPFAIAQGLVFVAFAVALFVSLRRFRA